ncbi:MAG: hypothetical protein ACKOPS_00375, partial [Cyanobium sp.]
MIKRLEQVAALVVAAGLAIVSYWLFFSWAQGGLIRSPAPQTNPVQLCPAGGRERAWPIGSEQPSIDHPRQPMNAPVNQAAEDNAAALYARISA